MELDEIMSMFESSEFILDKPLGGEFLLAFHAQRLELNKKKEDRVSTQSDSVK
jgi:CRISPR-associated protein Csd1